MSESLIDYHAQFKNYNGKKRFYARCPGRNEIVVAAPDYATAIVAAAEYFGEEWTKYEFYAFTDVWKAQDGKQSQRKEKK